MTDVRERFAAAIADRYRIEREIGAGGMATVYLAEDLRHRRQVAVKVLRPELAATLGSDRFFREIEVAARLQHPHILPLLDSGEADGFYFYVMPYISGESLRERLARQGELAISEAVKLLTEVVDGLSAAHAQGVVHRDIKPDNILLSGRHALITDFGVAKAVSEATGRAQLTTAGVALGTPAYMAPEQAAADPHIDHRVDIYAVGALAYEILTGRPPFSGGTSQEILAAHVTRAPEPVTSYRSACPPALAAVVMKCLEKRPADRWQSAEELLGQLEPLLMTPSGGMTPTQTKPHLPLPGRQFPRWAAWIAGGALVAAGAFALRLGQGAPSTLVLGRRSAVAASDAWEAWPSLSPDGKAVAYTLWETSAPRVAVQQVEGGAPLIVSAQVPGQAIYSPNISPDGARMLVGSTNGLYVMPTLGGQARLITPSGDHGSWSPDGLSVAYTTLDSLFTRRLDGGDASLVATGVDLHSAAWSPDGDWIAYVEGNPLFHVNGNSAPSAIRLVAAGGGEPVTIAEATSMNVSPIWIPGRSALLFISDRDGGRDIYQQALRGSGAPDGPPVRITTGLSPERISISADGTRLAWSAFTQTSNVWAIPLPERDSVPFSSGRPVTSGTQNVEESAVSRDGQWLYYDSDLGGTNHIWRVRLAGGPPERLTSGAGPNFTPTPSPDGREVAFHSLRNGADNRDIFVMPAAGGPEVQVSTSPGDDRAPDWSPDGRMLAWFDLQRADSSLLTARRGPDGAWEAPARHATRAINGPPIWFSDGKSLLTADSLGLVVRELDGEVRTRIWFGRPDRVIWAVSDDQVYLVSPGANGGPRIRRVPAPGAAPQTLAYADHPRNQGVRYGFGVGRDPANPGRVIAYLPLIEARLDVWVAEIEPR